MNVSWEYFPGTQRITIRKTLSCFECVKLKTETCCFYMVLPISTATFNAMHRNQTGIKRRIANGIERCLAYASMGKVCSKTHFDIGLRQLSRWSTKGLLRQIQKRSSLHSLLSTQLAAFMLHGYSGSSSTPYDGSQLRDQYAFAPSIRVEGGIHCGRRGMLQRTSAPVQLRLMPPGYGKTARLRAIVVPWYIDCHAKGYPLSVRIL